MPKYHLHIDGEDSFPLIKPLAGFKEQIQRKLQQFPYNKNVFLMLKFRDANKDLSDFIIENLKSHGFNGVRADQVQWNITSNVYNPIAVLYCCKYGIALFDEPEEHQAYNPNVAYELGMMHYQDKECLILRHSTLPSVPFDIIKDLHSPYTQQLEVRPIVKNWISQITEAESDSNSSSSVGTPIVRPAEKPPDEDVTLDPEIVSESEALQGKNLSFRITQRNKRYWVFSYQIQVKNTDIRGHRVHIRIYFKDMEGFTLGNAVHIHNQPIAPNELIRISDTTHIDVDVAGKCEISFGRAVTA